MKKWLAFVCLLVAGLGTAAAVAAGTETTGTVSVCATASTPAHTVGVDGADVNTIAGDTATQCATTTYTVPTVTETDTVTTTVGTTTTPAPPSADYSLADDGTKLSLSPTETTSVLDGITVAGGANDYHLTDGRQAQYSIVPGITGSHQGTYTVSLNVASSFAGAQLAVGIERSGAWLGGGWTAYKPAASPGVVTFTITDSTSTDWTATNSLQLFVKVNNTSATSGTLKWQTGGTSTLDVPFDVSQSPPPATGSVLFDGSASKMNALDVHSVSGPSSPCSGGVIGPTALGYWCVYQDPALWTCVCFINNDITLASDSTLGKAYDVNVPTGDTNEWGGSKSIDGAGQLSIRQDNDLGKWDYYGIAVKVPAWNGPLSDLYFLDIASLGYQTSSNDQVALGLYRSTDGTTLSYDLRVNGGYANGPQGNAPGTTKFRAIIKPVTFGQWDEFVIGVKWSTNTTGELKVYNRRPGGTWSVIFDRANIDTYLYGTITKADGSTQTFNQDGSNWPTVIDKIGLYFQEYAGESEHVQESGLTRSTDLATAESTLP